MSHLGEIGVEAQGVLDETFTFAGEVLRVNPDFSELDLIDFFEKADQVGENDPAAVTMVKKLFRSLVHPGDFEAFWATCKRTHQTSSSMVKIYSEVVERLSKRPTGPLSDSSPGQRSTPAPSTESYYFRELVRQEGRPDLQAVAVLHQEASQRA